MGRDAGKRKTKIIIKKKTRRGMARESIERCWPLSVEHWSIASCSSSFHLVSLRTAGLPLLPLPLSLSPFLSIVIGLITPIACRSSRFGTTLVMRERLYRDWEWESYDTKEVYFWRIYKTAIFKRDEKRNSFWKKKSELCAHHEADAATSQRGRGFS